MGTTIHIREVTLSSGHPRVAKVMLDDGEEFVAVLHDAERSTTVLVTEVRD